MNPEKLGERLRAEREDEYVLDIGDLRRDKRLAIAALASDIPDHPPNFERVKRANVDRESVADELANLELGRNDCE